MFGHVGKVRAGTERLTLAFEQDRPRALALAERVAYLVGHLGDQCVALLVAVERERGDAALDAELDVLVGHFFGNSMISVSTPPMSFGWRKNTGVPCAPVRVGPRMRLPASAKYCRASSMSSTSNAK